MLSSLRAKLLTFFRNTEDIRAVLLATVVGLAGGVGALLFRYLIGAGDRLFFHEGARVLSFLGGAYVILLPAIGLVVVAAVVRNFAPEARGHGVPEVMFAIRKRGGRIRPRVAIIKAFASALCIGSGGSVGREGPIVQIGCTIGSSIGQWLGVHGRQVRVLVACGAAAAIGGTFNAPIGGVIFAMEVILSNFAARSFGLVVISAVASTAVVQAVVGNEPAFALQRVFALRSPAELPIYLVLGVAAGLVAVVYVRVVYGLETLVERWRWHYLAKAAVGGLAVGFIGYYGIRYLGGRYLFGVGYDGIEAAIRLGRPAELSWQLDGGMTMAVLLLLLVSKLLATSLTLAADGSGGVFAPSLFLGATGGAAFGSAANVLFPEVTAPPGAYAIVGMAAVFAGSAHAPITAILILFEMTDTYHIILPLMIAVVVSYLVASSLQPDSIYTVKVRRRGGLAPTKAEPSFLDLIVAADAMSTDFVQVPMAEPISSLAHRFHSGHVRSACVIDDDGRLQGIVTEYDVESVLMGRPPNCQTAADIMTQDVVTCTRGQRLRDVLSTARMLDVGQLPVVDDEDPSHVIGVLCRREIFWAYGQLAEEHKRLVDERPVALPNAKDALVQEQFTVDADAPLAFAKLRGLSCPAPSRIVMVRRAERLVIPVGDTKLEPGDVVMMVTTPDRERELQQWIGTMAHASSRE